MKSIQGSSKRIESFSKIVHLFIALILGIFLSALGDRVLDDLDDWYEKPEYDDFINTVDNSEIENEIRQIENRDSVISDKLFQLETGLNAAKKNYKSAKESFDNWLETRKTIGDPNQDPEIIARLNKLDELNRDKLAWQNKLDTMRDSVLYYRYLKSDLNEKLEGQQEIIKANYKDALQSYNLKIFLIRLLFSLPLLALGVYLFIKYRDTKFRAFVWRVVFFSLYLFFIGLVPYMPSYGGYVRYIVGIVVTAVVGYYLIKQISAYFEKKKAELEKSVEERKDQIQYNTALKSYELNSCPSCEKDYKLVKGTDNNPNYCIHCGLILFDNCSNCGQRNYAHFQYCSSCGVELKTVKEVKEG